MRYLNGLSLLFVWSLISGNYALSIRRHHKRQQNDAISSPDMPNLRPLPWGDINFLHTTDTHGWLEGHVSQGSYNGDLGDFYSFAMRMKEKAREKKKDLFIIDTGDTHDGNGLSDITSPRGVLSSPLLTKIPYDLLTIGNHELYVNDVTQDTIENFIPHWKDRYLAANVYVKDLNNKVIVPISQNKYTYFEGEFGTRVLAYGFLFNFQKNGNLTVVKSVEDEIKQPWFQESLQQHQPDVIVLIGHIGLRFNEFYTLIKEIRLYYPTIPIAVFGGHTHIRDAVIYDSWAAGIESGRYLETIGFFSIKYDTDDELMSSDSTRNVTFERRYLDQNRNTYIYHSVDGKEELFDTKSGKDLSVEITQIRKEYRLSTQLGCAPQDYKVSAVAPDHPSSVYSLLTKELLPKIVTDPQGSNPVYFLINSGSVRYDIDKGPFLIENMFQLSPFEDYFYAVNNVPYDVARLLLPLLNDEGEKMMTERGVWPYVMEKLYDPSLNDGDVPSKPEHGKKSYSSRPLFRVQSAMDNVDEHHFLHSHQSLLTPGYVTVDDFGADGDDTEHIPIPDHPLPAFVGSELPKNETGLVDIVYLDFIDIQLRALLFKLTGKSWSANRHYGNPEVTSSTIWIKYAEQYWNSTFDCF